MELVNFRIVDGGRSIEIGGITVDLHNVANLRRQSHDVVERTLELSFSGVLTVPTAGVPRDTALVHELVLRFEEVVWARLQYKPDTNDPHPSLDTFSPFVGVLGSADEFNDFVGRHERDDWSRTYYLGFTLGVDILVEAERVRAELQLVTRDR
jgi:hypothetical protein